MERKLLNPWALCDGKFVSIEHARKGATYTCPKCNEPLTYCKKGEGQNAHQSHFKHRAKSTCSFYSPHDAESEIHKLAKFTVAEILKQHFYKHLDFYIGWLCPDCKE